MEKDSAIVEELVPMLARVVHLLNKLGEELGPIEPDSPQREERRGLSLVEAAARIGCGETTFRRLMAKYDFEPSYRLGHRVVFTIEDVDRLINRLKRDRSS